MRRQKSGESSERETQGEERQRVDLWLFRARFFKSRTLATRFVESGKLRLERVGQTVRVNRASALLQPGDRLIFLRGDTLLRLMVLGLPAARGPASAARALYESEDTPLTAPPGRTGAE